MSKFVKKSDIVYPNGTHKAVTMRFDDGTVSDRQMVKLLNRYDLKVTLLKSRRRPRTISSIKARMSERSY